jgi:cytochrome c oxidase assembly factor CtaG
MNATCHTLQNFLFDISLYLFFWYIIVIFKYGMFPLSGSRTHTLIPTLSLQATGKQSAYCSYFNVFCAHTT